VRVSNTVRAGRRLVPEAGLRSRIPPILPALALIAILAGAPEAAAQTISIAPGEAPSLPASSAAPWKALVSACMNRLFNAGMIATDAVPFVGDRARWEAPGFGVAEAREGYVDYLIAVWAEWKLSAFKKGTLLPAKIEYRVVEVATGAGIGSGSYDGPADSIEAAGRAEAIAASMGASIAAACSASLYGGKR
jgi:hypothetical protein